MRQFYIFKTARILTAEDIRKLQQVILTGLFVTIIVFLQTIVLNARGAPESFADLVEDVGSSVVNITTTTKVESPVVPWAVVPEGSPFEELFRDFQNPNGPRQRPRNANALGSGFDVFCPILPCLREHLCQFFWKWFLDYQELYILK